MKDLFILWFSRHRRSRWEEMVEPYRKRIARTVTIRDRPMRSRGAGDLGERRAADAKRLLAALPDPCWLVSLDEGGSSWTSTALAERLREWQESWPHPVVFAIGSDAGLAPEVVERSRDVLSLSAMTLPHELARLVLYEQLYRALTILQGTQYHRAH